MPDFDFMEGVQLFTLSGDNMTELHNSVAYLLDEDEFSNIRVIPHKPATSLISFRTAQDWLPLDVEVRPFQVGPYDTPIWSLPTHFITDYGRPHLGTESENFDYFSLYTYRMIYPNQQVPNCAECSEPITYPYIADTINGEPVVRSSIGIHVGPHYDGSSAFQQDRTGVYFNSPINELYATAFLYAVNVRRVRRITNNNTWDYLFDTKTDYLHLDCLSRHGCSPQMCAECATISDASYMTQVRGNNGEYFICSKCESVWEYRICHSCDCAIDDSAWSYDYDCCDECAENRQSEDDYEDSSIIHNYSYKPYPHFLRDYDVSSQFPNLFFGAEIEVEMRRDYEYETTSTARSVFDSINGPSGNFAYLKHDGSLSNGFEIVTHPATFEWWVSDDNPILNGIAEYSHKLRSYHSQNCGMHIHMSKAEFSNYHLMRFLWFIHNRQEYVEFIAQRRSNNYARFSDSERNNVIKIAKAKYSNQGRFVAVNLENSETIELRVFKGNIRPKRILKNIEFCHALYAYTFIDTDGKGILDLELAESNSEVLSDITKDLTVDQFNTWVKEHAATYPNLSEFINYWRS